MRPLWDAVEQCDLEVIIDPGPPGNPGYQVEQIDAVTSRMESTQFVLAHLGYLTSDLRSSAVAKESRRRLLALARKPNVWLGLAAVPVLLEEAYPCPASTQLLREAVELVGA